MGIAFQFYNMDLVDLRDPKKGEEVIAFMDDTLLLAHGKMLSDTNNQLKHMMTRSGGGLDWSTSQQCKFMVDKFGVMGLT